MSELVRAIQIKLNVKYLLPTRSTHLSPLARSVAMVWLWFVLWMGYDCAFLWNVSVLHPGIEPEVEWFESASLTTLPRPLQNTSISGFWEMGVSPEYMFNIYANFRDRKKGPEKTSPAPFSHKNSIPPIDCPHLATCEMRAIHFKPTSHKRTTCASFLTHYAHQLTNILSTPRSRLMS